MKKYWDVKMVSDKVGELLLYAEISNEMWWGDEVTPKQVDADLKALGELDQLNVRINSPGGNVFAGQAIYSIIKRHEAKVKNAYIDGLAASMATVIPLACHKVYMFSNATQMIHKPEGSVSGTADLMRQRADMIDKMEGIILDIYEEKTGLDRKQLQDMLRAETWMTAKEALEYGFIDEIEEGMKVAACLDGDFLVFGDTRVNLAKCQNFPETYRAALPLLEPVVDKKEDTDPPGDPDPKILLMKEQSDRFRALRTKIITYEEDK